MWKTFAGKTVENTGKTSGSRLTGWMPGNRGGLMVSRDVNSGNRGGKAAAIIIEEGGKKAPVGALLFRSKPSKLSEIQACLTMAFVCFY